MPTLEELDALVARFNAAYPVGSFCDYRWVPDVPPMGTKTTCDAFVLSGHTAVTFVDGIAGCVALEALTMQPTPAEANANEGTIHPCKVCDGTHAGPCPFV